MSDYIWSGIRDHVTQKFGWYPLKFTPNHMDISAPTYNGTATISLTRRMQLYGWELKVVSSDGEMFHWRTWKRRPDFEDLLHAMHRSITFVEPVPVMFRMVGRPVAVFLTMPHPNNPHAREGIDAYLSGVEISDWDSFIQRSTPLSKSVDMYHDFYHDIVDETGLRLDVWLRNGARAKKAFRKNRNLEIYLQPRNPHLKEKNA